MTKESSILQAGHAGYPQRLRALGIDRTLHVRGVLAAGPALAIVGARAASQHAMERAHAWAKHAAARGVNVVSGGALGIDGAAHRGALEAMVRARSANGVGDASAGSTTVVLGTGIDVVYPARHAPLFDQIVRAGGALVSMFPPRAEPRPWMFTARNALVSALADVVIVVEADVRSGSLSTALAAQKQGRVVAAYPGSRGCSALLAEGCAVVENERDVLALVAGDARYPASVILDETACRVREAIAAGARDVDAIVRHTGLSVRVVLRALPQLESLARLQ